LLENASVPSSAGRAPGIANGFVVLTHILVALLAVLSALAAVLLVARRKTPEVLRPLGYIAVGTLPLLLAVHLSRTLAAQYDPDRVAMQALLPLSIAVAWVTQKAVRRLPDRRVRRVAIGAIVVSLLVLLSNSSGLTGATLGSSTSLNLASRGAQFERMNITEPELASAHWLGSLTAPHPLVYADELGAHRLVIAANMSEENIIGTLVPQVIDRHAWVYGSTRNIADGRAEANDVSDVLYKFPFGFLNDNFNTVYANGSSEIFHR
jgi:hypothetical protein